ncbi:MAG: sigma 54-interacting transcriptional regulator [Acidobacteriia bacterium]|nr:sigma 54-interacting transcriptional regulator [Terriglobia bacterium]
MAGPDSLEPANLTAVERYRALLRVSESIAAHRDLPELFRSLAALLHRLVTFDFICLTLPDPAHGVVRLHVLEGSIPTRFQPGFEIPMEEDIRQLVWENQQPLVISNLEHDDRFPIIVRLLREDGVRSLCALPLTTAQRRVGAMALGSVEVSAYDAADLEFLQQVAAQVAVAVDNTLNFQNAQAYQQELARERDRLRLLLEVNNALVSTLDLRQLLSAISACLRRVMNHEYASLALYDPAAQQLRLQALDFPRGKGFLQEEMIIPLEGTPPGEVIVTRKPLIISSADVDRFHPDISRLFIAEGLRSGCIVPLITANRILGTLSLASLRPGAFTQEDLDLLVRVANQVGIAIENALAYREIAELKNKLVDEKLYLEEEIRTEYTFEEIVGESPALKRVLSQVETVAATDSTVLILGETGTGKEVIARAIHDLSLRRERTFVKVNCAAIPTGLLESELFGHERGAFTGAIAQKVGRFELAHRGTLFLDEVGDIPLELQPKLLRVLQEKEFERLGSTRTLHVDVRVVAATNRDLPQMVEGRLFRSDLYYRLNVFPIVVPPLRERAGDIPLLVRYFAQKYARRMDRRIETIPAEEMEALTRYHWPGNVRELENLIERYAPGTLFLGEGRRQGVEDGVLHRYVGGRDGLHRELARADDVGHLAELRDPDKPVLEGAAAPPKSPGRRELSPRGPVDLYRQRPRRIPVPPRDVEACGRVDAAGEEDYRFRPFSASLVWSRARRWVPLFIPS